MKSHSPAIWAVVPIKRFDQAKQRLSGMFPTDFRRRLARTMVEDVLAALAGSRRLGGILVVTVDPDAVGLARRYGAEICTEGAGSGHTGAVVAGGRWLHAAGHGGMLALPGDIPGVTSQDIDMLLACHGDSPGFAAGFTPGFAPGFAPGFTIVPSHDRRGSNAIVATPPDAVPLAYGDDSFLPHLAAARAAGLEPRIVDIPGIALDVDAPADLFAVAAAPWSTRTHAFLAASPEFAERSSADD